MRNTLLALVVLAVFSVNASAGLVKGPEVCVLVNGQDSGLIIRTLFDDVSGIYQLDGSISNENYAIEISGAMKIDPHVVYGIAVTNHQAVPTTFTFTFGTPIFPDYYSIVTASISGSTTDVAGDGVSVMPVGAKLQAGFGSSPVNDLGVDVGNGFSAGPGSPVSSYVIGPDAAANVIAPTFFDTLSTTLSFTLSSGDIATINGGVVILVPEPATLSLLALAGLGLLRRRNA